MEAKIALIMNTPDDELDEVLEAAGFEQMTWSKRGKKAVNRVLASLQEDADFITSLPISKRKRSLTTRHPPCCLGSDCRKDEQLLNRYQRHSFGSLLKQ